MSVNMASSYDEHKNLLRIRSIVGKQVCYLTSYGPQKYGVNMMSDLIQECFERVLKGKDKFRDESKFESWSFRVCRNSLMNLERHNSRQMRVINSKCLSMSDSADLVEDSLNGDEGDVLEMLSVVDHCYKQYTASEQQMLRDFVFGMEDAEISGKWGVSYNRVKDLTEDFEAKTREAIYD